MAGIRTPDLTSSSSLTSVVGNKETSTGVFNTVKTPVESLAAQIQAITGVLRSVVRVKSRSLSTPPASPANYDTYIVGAAPTGDWAGHANDIAIWTGAWTFTTPTAGSTAVIDDEHQFVYYDGAETRWLLPVKGDFVLADDYGAAGDGVTDDRTAILNAAVALGPNGGLVILSSKKNYRIATNLTVPVNVTIRHGRGYGGNPGVNWLNGPLASQPHIKLDSTATITMSSNSGFEGVILRTGLIPPVTNPASYAGTAIKLAAGRANDVRVRALIVGFAICFDGTNGGDHYDLQLECDGNPPAGSGAVILGTSFDTSRARIRCYPWGTVGAFGQSPVLTRSGIGIQILLGAQDDSRLDLFSFGYSTGILSAGFGNIHFEHIWVENSTSYGIQFDSGGRIAIDGMWVNNCLGVKFNANGDFSIGYMMHDTAGVVGAEGMNFTPGIVTNVHIGKWEVVKIDGWAINVASLSAFVDIDNARLLQVHGGIGPYIVGAPGWTIDQVNIRTLFTDLPAGHSLMGGNVLNFQQIASAATVYLPASGRVFSVTGVAAIDTIDGAWGGREITLMVPSASLTQAGNISLINGATLQGAAGVVVDLIYDAVANKWLEKGRYIQKTGWGAPTGTLDRTALATYAGHTVSNAYVQADAQATDDACKKVSQELGALITDLRALGVLAN